MRSPPVSQQFPGEDEAAAGSDIPIALVSRDFATPARRYCVFTSAGDFSVVAAWVPPGRSRTWDLIIAFYGDDPQEFEGLRAVADLIVPMKGGKFPNLHRLHRTRPHLLDRYDRVWVMDDDLEIAPADLDRMFEIATRFGFAVCQPAFSPKGRVSLDITRVNRETFARAVNFIENTCPLFETRALLRFLSIYDGSIRSGWGIDYWFCQVLSGETDSRLAIIDDVIVLNPRDHQRPGGKREILRFGGEIEHWREWRRAAEEFGLREFNQIVKAEIRQPNGRRGTPLRFDGDGFVIRSMLGIGPPRERDPIPKLIMQAWPTRSLPREYAVCVNSVREVNPDHVHELWDESEMRGWIARLYPWFAEKFAAYGSPFHRLDVIRYFWLFHTGGFYLDVDIHALRPLKGDLSDADVILGQSGADPASTDVVPNAVMGSRPRQQFWLYVIARLVEGRTSGSPSDITGNGFLRESIERWHLETKDQRAERTARVRALLPASGDRVEPTTSIRFLPRGHWFPLDPAEPVHRFVRRSVLGSPPMPSDVIAEMFPDATLATFWPRHRD